VKRERESGRYILKVEMKKIKKVECVDTLILGERIDKNKINKENTADKGEVERERTTFDRGNSQVIQTFSFIFLVTIP